MTNQKAGIRKEKNLFTALFLVLIILSFITSFIAGILFYFNIYLASQKNFREKSEKTAHEVTNIISGYLYNVDNNGVLQIAHLYLNSGSVAGIEVYSEADGSIIKDVRTDDPGIRPVLMRAVYNDMHLGHLRLWFDNKEQRIVQNKAVFFMFFVSFVLFSINILTFLFLFKKIFMPSINSIYLKIENISKGIYEGLLERTGYKELNIIINALNNMLIKLAQKTKKLEYSEKKYAEIFNSTFVAVFIHDMDGNLIDVNDTMIKMYGLSSKEEALKYSLVNDYSSEENVVNKLKQKWARIKNGFTDVFEWNAKRPLTGEIFKVEVSLKKVKSDEHDYVLANVMDITEKKNIEEKFLQSQKLEAIGTLSGGLAHEFNNALLGISGSVSLLEIYLFENKKGVSEDIAVCIDNIKKSVDRSASIVQQLMSVSRKQKLILTEIDLRIILDRVINIAKTTFDKSINIIYEEHDTAVGILADNNQMEQVFLNLFVNANHAMTIMRPADEKWGGSIELKIKKIQADGHLFFQENDLNPDKTADYWDISIKDTGVGISKNNISNIFTPFFTTKESGKGSGLGLSVVYSIIKQHNGYINVQSELKAGTVFDIYIPFAGSIPEKKEDKKRIFSIVKRSGKILLADDEDGLRDIVKKILEKFGYNVIEADNGKKAVELFKENYLNIDCVILDISMPVMSGSEVLAEIKKIDPDVKVIISSGYDIEARFSESEKNGVSGFIQKPYDADRLIDVLEKTLLLSD